MGTEQGRTVALATALLLVVLMARTRAMEWLSTAFSYVPFNWDFNPFDWGSATSKSGGSSTGTTAAGAASSSGFASSAAYQPGPGGQGGVFQGKSGATYSGSYASLTQAQKADVNAFANNT